MGRPSIDILLAVYNGASFLPALFDSLLAQTEQDFRVLVGDNGSADGTVRIVGAYEARFGGRLALMPLDPVPGSAMGNFARLVDAAEAPYVMFCDCDDVWLPGKIEATLRCARLAEARHGREMPILVHTDLTVVDANLQVIDRSFWHYQFLRPQRAALNQLLVQNVVTGCTVLANRALLLRARPIPEAAIMHDWWFALVAAATGRIETLPVPTILYRQHGSNDTGAKRWSWKAIARKAITARSDMKLSISRTQAQAAAFLERFGDEIGPIARATVSAYATMPAASGLERRWRLARHGLWKIGVARNVGLLLRV